VTPISVLLFIAFLTLSGEIFLGAASGFSKFNVARKSCLRQYIRNQLDINDLLLTRSASSSVLTVMLPITAALILLLGELSG
jgi:hypothetical protein